MCANKRSDLWRKFEWREPGRGFGGERTNGSEKKIGNQFEIGFMTVASGTAIANSKLYSVCRGFIQINESRRLFSSCF